MRMCAVRPGPRARGHASHDPVCGDAGTLAHYLPQRTLSNRHDHAILPPRGSLHHAPRIESPRADRVDQADRRHGQAGARDGLRCGSRPRRRVRRRVRAALVRRHMGVGRVDVDRAPDRGPAGRAQRPRDGLRLAAPAHRVVRRRRRHDTVRRHVGVRRRGLAAGGDERTGAALLVEARLRNRERPHAAVRWLVRRRQRARRHVGVGRSEVDRARARAESIGPVRTRSRLRRRPRPHGAVRRHGRNARAAERHLGMEPQRADLVAELGPSVRQRR